MNLEIKGRFCAGNTHFKWRAADVDSENQEARQGHKEVRIHEKEIMGVRSGQLQHEEVEMKTNQEGIASLSGC